MVKTEDLKRIRFLKTFPDHLLGILAHEAQLRIFSTDTLLITVNKPIDTFYMLLMGQVAITRELTPDIDVILDYIQSGSSFGSSALRRGSRAAYTAVCQEPCEVMTLSGQSVIQLCAANDELAYHIMLGISKQYKKRRDTRARMIMKVLDKNPGMKDEIKDIENLTLTI